MSDPKREDDRDADTAVARPSGAVSSSRRSVPEPEDHPTDTILPGGTARPSAATIRALRLELEDVIGTGGMGIVFRGEQTDLQRPVAFKQLAHEPSDEMRARFVREARLTARLDHPNIVPVHVLETGAEGEATGYAMKLVEGKTLASLLREARNKLVLEQPLEPDHHLEARLETFLKVCDAIAFAHERGIIHRDLKPANVMIGAFGAVYVMDWGIARSIQEADPEHPGGGSIPDDALTQVGAVIGTAAYMSPEQARAENATLDARSDQYALGLLLQELITLQPANPHTDHARALAAARAGETVPLDGLGAGRGAPRELRAIVGRALAKDRDDRYPTTRALADDVRRYLRGEAPEALPEGPLGRLVRFTARHRRATLGIFAFVLALAALAVVWSRYRATAHELAARERGAELTALYRDVARQAARIDRQLFRMEEGLEGLATAAEWALAGAEPAADTPIYFEVDYLDPAKRPSDFTDRTAYRWPVSVDQPVVGVAPRVDRTALLPAIRRVVPLVEQMRGAVIAAALGDTEQLAPADARRFLLERKSPIDYTYIDLAEGVHVVWPGVAALPPDYDVRTSSFYKLSEGKHGKRWGAPYVDATTDQAGDDLVLPCTQGLWVAGRFVGVAGVEITVTKLVETTMRLANRTALRTRLVGSDGGVIIDSQDANKRFATSGTDDAVEFSPLDLPAIAQAIAAGEEGLRETTRDGRPIAVAFVRLDAIGWYYVVEVDAVGLGQRAR